MPSAAYILAIVLPHGFYQVYSANNIVSVIQHGKLHALSHSFAPSKMDDSIKPAALLVCVTYATTLTFVLS